MSITKLIAEAEKLSAKATPGPWKRGKEVDGCAYVGTKCDDVYDEKFGYNFAVRDGEGQRDADFIARSRTLLPAAIAALKVASRSD